MLCCRRHRGRLLCSAIATIFAATPAMAVTHTWNGGNAFGPDSMNNSLNWSGGTPVSGNTSLTLIFPNGASSFSPNQNIANPLAVQSLQYSSNYFVVGNTYQMSNLGANPSITSSSGLQFNAGLSIAAPTLISGTNNITLKGNLSGNGDITLSSGSGLNLQFQNVTNNSYFGNFTVGPNTQVNLQGGGTAMVGDLNIFGGVVIAQSPNQFGPNTDLSIDGISSFLQMFSGANQNVRDVTLSNNTSIQINNATLTATGAFTNLVGSNSIGTNQFDNLTLGGGLQPFDTQGTSQLTIPSRITNGRIFKTGPGTLQITAPNNAFTGQNIVNAGILRGSVDSIGLNVLNNATVELFGGNLNTPVISGAGQVVITGSVTYAAAQTYSGGTDIRAFGNAFGDSSTLLGSFTSSTGSGVLQFNQTTNGTFAGSLSGGLEVDKFGPGTLTLGGGNTHTFVTNLYGGGLRLTSNTALGSAPLQIGASSDPASIEAVGNRTFANPLLLGYNLNVVGAGTFNFTDTAIKTLNNILTHNSTGSTTIAGKFNLSPSGTIVVNAGSLTLGDPAAVGGFTAGGSVAVNGGILTVRSLNFTTLPDVTLAGGTLNAPNGYAIPLGAALQGNGGVTGRVSSANGSTILANGNLTIGDAAHVAGVNLDGELYTNQFTVQLADANQAVLGSLTDIGTALNPGTLIANKGLVLNFGRNLTGYGTVQSINSLANAVIANGDVNGDSLANALDFTGYVKGVGTFNNVIFSGTFAPGLSPALLTVGNLAFGPSNTLEIEIGGLSRGGQYDALDVTGAVSLNGLLKVILINGFNPAAGDTFDIFNGVEIGTFSSYNFPPLSVGLVWDTSNLYTQGELKVVPVPEPVAFLSGVAVLGLLVRRRR